MQTVVKISLVALAVLIWAAPNSNADVHTDKGLQYYFAKAGISSSSVVGKDRQVIGIDPSASFGGTAGVGLGYALNRNFILQPEFVLTTKGFKVPGEENQLNVRYNFAEIPVLLKLRSHVIADIKPNIYIGPVLSFKLNSAIWADNADPSLATNDTDLAIASMHEGEDETESIDYGMVLGIDFHSFSNSILVDFRYSMGMRSMVNEGNYDVRHSNVMLTVGYIF